MKKYSKKIIVSSALALALITSAQKVVADDWHANSIETIVENVNTDKDKYNDKVYDIRWGDYLWGISKATKVDIDTLAQINDISNKDLIIAGNKLYYGADSNIVTKDNKTGQTKVYQEKKYDGSNEVKETPKKDLSGREEQAIVEKNPGLSKDFSSKDKINDKIIKDNKKQIKDLDKEIEDIKKDADEKIKEQEDIKKDLDDKKDKLIKEDKEKQAEIDEKIKEADKKQEDIKKDLDEKLKDKEKQKDYLETENEKLEADKKGDKEEADKKQEELDDKKENDPYEIWKKEQLEKNPKLKEEDLTREQYEIAKKDKDSKEDKKEEGITDNPKEDKGESEGKKDDDKVLDEGDKEDAPTEDTKKPEEKPKKDDEVESKTKVIREVIPYKTNRAINDPNLKTRVAQEGKNGLKVINVSYDENGNEKNRQVDENKSCAPVNEVIESYVKVQDAKYETRWKDQYFARGITEEVYQSISDEEWESMIIPGTYEMKPEAFEKYGVTKYFDTYKEATRFEWSLAIGQSGTADSVQYEVKVQEEVWEWK